MKRPRGRPPKEPDDLMTISEAADFLKEYLATKYSPTVAERLALAKGTIYNKTAAGELHTWRKGKYALVSKAEIIKLVG